MAKFENSEFFGNDFLTKISKDAETLIKFLDQIEKEMISIAAVQKTIIEQSNTNTAKGIRETTTAVTKLNEAEQITDKIRKDKLKAERQLKIARSDRIQSVVELREQIRSQNQANREAVRENPRITGAYAAQSATLRRLVKQYQNLAAQGKANTEQARNLLRQITPLDRRLKEIDQTVGRSQRNVGNYGSALNRLRTSFLNVARAAGLTFGVFGAIRTLRGATNIVRDFEKENAVLAGVLNQTTEEISDLTDDAVRLGSETAKTASEVTQLQIAYSRLGFTQREIIDLTEDTISGSIALNAELDQTAELVGAVVNTFDDFGTTDAANILDQLTASTQQSALNFERLETALPIVSGAANAANVPFSRLLSLLGKVADAGIDASSSATALRNIFLESAKQGRDYEEILAEITSSQDALTAANENFGKRAAVTATVLANNIENVNDLQSSLENAGGTAQRVAEVQLNTLEGALQLLRSAYEGFILSLNESNRATNAAARIIRFIAQNFRSLVAIIGVLTAAFVTYRLTLLAVRNGALLYNTAVRGAAVATALFTGNTQKATTALRVFNTTVKGSPLGFLAGLLTTVVGLFLVYADNAEEATKAQKELNEAQRESARIQESFTGIENRVATIERLNRRQLQNLLRDIETEIQANEDKNANILANEIDIAREAEKIRRESSENITELERLLTEELSEEAINRQTAGVLGSQTEAQFRERQALLSRRETAKIELDRQRDQLNLADQTAMARAIIQEGITRDEVNQNLIRLRSDRELVLARLRGIREVQRASAIEPIERDFATDLARLRLELERINSARERLVTGITEQEIESFNALTLQKEELEEIIKLLERRLSGENDIEQRQLESLEKIKQQTEANEKAFREANEKRIQDEIEAEEALAQLRSDLIQISADVIDERFQRNLDQIDRGLNNSFQRVDQLISVAQNARLASGESIAFERREQAKLERERERNRRRQERARALAAVLQSFNANDGDLLRTVADTQVLRGLANTLVGFWDGTDNVAKSMGKPHLSGRDGYIIRADGKEQIWSDKDQKETGYRSREEIKQIVKNVDSGLVQKVGNPNVAVFNPKQDQFSDKNMIRHLRKIKTSIDSGNNSKDSFFIEMLRGFAVYASKKDSKKTKNYIKLK